MQDEFVRDISGIDYTSGVTIENPKNMDACIKLKQATNARICVGRTGTGYKTETLLRFLCDHVAAMDSVWADVDETLVDF